MNLEEYLNTLKQDSVPGNISPILQALWWDARGSWDKAHRIVQEINSADAALVHAYLHRKEGDESNSRYWYSRAGKNFYHGSIDDEWFSLVEQFTNLY